MSWHNSIILLATLLPSAVAFAQDNALTITIPELATGKTFTFSYDGVVADPFNSLDAVNATQQAVVEADGGISASSLDVVTRLDNPPVLDLNGAGEAGVNYTTAFVQIDGPIGLTAPDAQIGERAMPFVEFLQVAVSSIPNGTDESLDADVSGTPGISKNYDPLTGILTLSGTESIASYEQVLRTVTYNNIATTINPAQRTATFTAHDDFSESTAAATFTVGTNSIVIDWSTY